MEYVIVMVVTPVMFGISLLIRRKIFLPLLCSIPAFVGYLMALKSSILSAFAALLLWTILQSILVLVSSRRNPEKMKALILRSEQYSGDMFKWIETGVLPEGSPWQVIRFHLLQTILYCLLALLTANFASIVLGCVLLNYMNFYVSQLAGECKNRWRAFLLGWNFWSVIRVMAFLWLGAVLGIFVASYIVDAPPFDLKWLLPGIAGVILDLILKLVLSNWWRKKLALLLS
jgi:hypothetical protein